ncbi:Cytochrome P450 4g1 [Lucilia cuprina]|nr:Cytochrome P450 4g1 [Lucilia cuprina]
MMFQSPIPLSGSSFVLCMLGIHKGYPEEKYGLNRRLSLVNNMSRDCTLPYHGKKYLENVLFMETLRMYPPSTLELLVVLITMELHVVVLQFAYIVIANILSNPNKYYPDNFLPNAWLRDISIVFIPSVAGPEVSLFEDEEDVFQLQVILLLKIGECFYVLLEPRQNKDGVRMKDNYNTTMSVETLQTTIPEMAGETLAATASSGPNPLVTLLFGLGVIAALYEYYRRNNRAAKLLETIPTPPQIPLLGHGHMVFGTNNVQTLKIAMELIKTYGETVRVMLGHLSVVFITNPKDVEIVLSGYKHLEKSVEYRYFQPWFGNGLLISNGHHWRHHRKMIAPTFHQSILKSFVPTFVNHSKAVVGRLSANIGKEFDVHKYMSETTVDILLTTAMGCKTKPETEKSAEYAEAVMNMCDIIHNRQLKLLYRLDSTFNFTKMREQNKKLMNVILSMTRKVVEDRKKNFNAEERGIIDKVDMLKKKQQQAKKDGLRDDLDDIDENDVGEKRRLALLDAMMEMEKSPDIKWTEKDVMDEVNTIMFEGHDTTASGSSFALCAMGIHQDIQQRVFEEQQAIFGDDLQRDCTFADTLQMTYLERVICETLRLFPPVPIIARKLEEDIRLKSGPYIIPKGTTVVVSQFFIHRRADTFPDPEKFNPDNFLPERSANRHYYSYIPFSAGPRSCVGRKFAMLQLKVLLSTIIRNYRVSSSRTEKDFDLQGDIILKLGNGFQIGLEPRTTIKV